MIFADPGDGNDTSVLRAGKVHIYNSQINPDEVKPFHVLKVDVHFSMVPVLKSIAEKWSLIESMRL